MPNFITLEDDINNDDISAGALEALGYDADANRARCPGGCNKMMFTYAISRVSEGQYQCRHCAMNAARAIVAAAPKPDKTLDRARATRNRLLNASDWTQIADNRLTQQERDDWATYREAVRAQVDAVKNGDPAVWPTPPSTSPEMGGEEGDP